MAESTPTKAIAKAIKNMHGEMIRAISAAQLPVSTMPKLLRAKGGEFNRQEFLREAEVAIALSQRPAATYLPGPIRIRAGRLGSKKASSKAADGKSKHKKVERDLAKLAMIWDAGRCSPSVKLTPERMMTYARLDTSGWGYVATAMAGPSLDGASRRYYEIIVEEGGWGCMMGLADPQHYSIRDGAACDSPAAWVLYCNNGKYFSGKRCVGESGARVRAGDTLGVLYQIRDAEKPADWHPQMGEVSGREGFLTFFVNGVQLPGGHVNVAQYETTEDKGEHGVEYATVATPLELVPVVDFYSSARLKITRGTQQDNYVHHLTKMSYKL
eukprot:g5221.t1